METLEQCVKPIQSEQKRHQNDVNDVAVVSFRQCFYVSIVDFEQVHSRWAVKILLSKEQL